MIGPNATDRPKQRGAYCSTQTVWMFTNSRMP
jgi:hypothetical protein